MERGHAPLRNVLPLLAIANNRHQRFGYTEGVGDLFMRTPISAYLTNLVSSQLGRADGVAFRLSVFVLSVMHVVGVRPKEKMIRVHTRRIVAMMADAHTRWYGSAIQLVASAMSAFVSAEDTQASIAPSIFTAVPYPTERSLYLFGDARIESFFFSGHFCNFTTLKAGLA